MRSANSISKFHVVEASRLSIEPAQRIPVLVATDVFRSGDAQPILTRRQILQALGIGTALIGCWPSVVAAQPTLFDLNPAWDQAIKRGLHWLTQQQTRTGQWADDEYPTAISALAAMALICSGSTTTQGPYASQIRLAVDFMISKCRKNGLIGDPKRDDRYTYGHGFAMLFLSQVLGEEEDLDRREELIEVLNRAIRFSVDAQTKEGGWGYVSAKMDNFDEGSTTITQVQGLRGCRNAGLVVPTQAIEKAKKYIYKCQNRDGGISYSTTSLGSSRPAITAAALAALYNAGDYESAASAKMWDYSKKNLHNLNSEQYGHWHYTYLYYTQVVYRQPIEVWHPFRDKLYNLLVSKQAKDGQWTDDSMGENYVTAVNLIILQMDFGYLPIFQK